MVMLLSSLLIRTVSLAQHDRSPVLLFDSVPLIVETDLFVDSVFPGKKFVFVSGRLKVYVSRRAAGIKVNGVFRLQAKSLDSSRLQNLEYEVRSQEGDRLQHWRKVPQNGLMVDTALDPGKGVILLIRNRKSKIILQRNYFLRASFAPGVTGYKQSGAIDLHDVQSTSTIAFVENVLLPGYSRIRDSLDSDTIKLRPGDWNRLQFISNRLNFDSAIQFRFYDQADKASANWLTTGHILLLPPTLPDHHYLLLARFKGSDEIAEYHIYSPPFWYQERRAMISFYITCVVAIGVFGFLVYRAIVRSRLKRREMTRAKMKATHNKLNPHFVRNAISSIGSLVSDSQHETANRYLSALSDMMQGVLVNSDRLVVPLTEELANLEKYLVLEQLRFGFQFRFEIDSALDVNDIEIPSMFLQPSIENAVHHGVAGMGSAGLIIVSFLKSGESLFISIRDNGNRLVDTATPLPGHGNGTAITRELIGYLQQLIPYIEIHYGLRKTDDGTEAGFEFTNWLN